MILFYLFKVLFVSWACNLGLIWIIVHVLLIKYRVVKKKQNCFFMKKHVRVLCAKRKPTGKPCIHFMVTDGKLRRTRKRIRSMPDKKAYWNLPLAPYPPNLNHTLASFYFGNVSGDGEGRELQVKTKFIEELQPFVFFMIWTTCIVMCTIDIKRLTKRFVSSSRVFITSLLFWLHILPQRLWWMWNLVGCVSVFFVVTDDIWKNGIRWNTEFWM